MLIIDNDKKILIDGLCNSQMPIYRNPPAEIREKIIRGVPPFDNLDAMLITHHHEDHFDSLSINEFLQQHPNTMVVSTHEVISRLKSGITSTKNLVELNPSLHGREKITVNDINIQAISMIHDGKGFEHIQSLVFLIENGKKILHIGDAGPLKENYLFLNLKQASLDLLIVTFPYVGLPSARQIIKEHIYPQKIAVVHLPREELDSYGWITATKKSYKSVANTFIETVFLEEIGSWIDL